jgi:hypothetical protein
MKVFRFTTEVQSVKTIQYIIEAENVVEAAKILQSGSERDEGEEVEELIYWETETIIESKLIEEL